VAPIPVSYLFARMCVMVNGISGSGSISQLDVSIGCIIAVMAQPAASMLLASRVVGLSDMHCSIMSLLLLCYDSSARCLHVGGTTGGWLERWGLSEMVGEGPPHRQTTK
jgi:hypothetical protein